ncbi:SPASM domain-containing protein [Paenibacillus faecalis]|uniref:SPASM domain-containing protein n=1 Tax=Paenibacillus faecalis TaxID=2079532 RepID=UPI003B3BE84B
MRNKAHLPNIYLIAYKIKIPTARPTCPLQLSFIFLNDLDQKNILCANCKYLKICGTGCRANAFESFGDIYRKDPLNCEVLPLFEKHISPLFSRETRENFAELTSLNNE